MNSKWQDSFIKVHEGPFRLINIIAHDIINSKTEYRVKGKSIGIQGTMHDDLYLSIAQQLPGVNYE